ncbi:hypothetical protein [Enemella evansiae]|uniref:hypothetical protein n=1 Tax=Enemella evansiae TaxID=2016499 RepID=UPI000B9662E1|nr:hypothetical protein [Enemella evansiae]OYO08476.1 hypothetical protein BI335_19420 [Enemella evansiae]TDO93668.1 hypothetical protein C8D81_1456 [Enemella evansiae]
MTNIDLQLRAARPTDDELAAEFPTARRQELLDGLLSARSDEPVIDAPATTGPRPSSRFRIIAVAAGVLVVTGIAIGVQLAPNEPPAEQQQPGPVGGVLAPPVAAAATLGDLAERARTSVDVPAGAYRLVVRSQGDGLTINTYTAGDGWTWRKDTRPGSSTFYSVLRPTSEVAPSDPAALQRWLSERATGTESTTQAMFKEIGELVRQETTPPAVRAAAIQVLSSLADESGQSLPRPKDPGMTTPLVTVERAELAGKAVLVAQFTDRSQPAISASLTFDARSSEVVAESGGRDRALQTSYRRETVNALPADVIDAVGTERREQMVTRG